MHCWLHRMCLHTLSCFAKSAFFSNEIYIFFFIEASKLKLKQNRQKEKNKNLNHHNT